MIRKYAIIVFMVILSSCEPNNDVNTTTLRLYGDALEDIGYSIAKTNDGYVIGGQFTEVTRDGSVILVEKSSKKLAIIRTDADGKEIWKKSFGDGLVDAVGSKVITLTDGSFVATGYKVDTTKNNTKDIFVVKVSADGSTSAEKTYKQDGNQYGIDILQTTEGFIILGSTDVERGVKGDSLGNAAGKKDICLLRINSTLDEIGSIVYGYSGNDTPSTIKEDPNGDFIVLGTTDNSWKDQALNNLLFFKTNLYGKVKEINIIGNKDDEYASDFEVLDDGYLIAGTVGADGSDQSVLLTKIHKDNIYLPAFYSKKFKLNLTSSTATSFAVRSIARYSADQFVLAGQAGTGASARMMIFVADAEGQQIAGKDMITSATGTQVAYDVISDETDNIIAVGKNSFGNNSLISFLKIRF